MRLTQAQVRHLADVNEETFRVWREGLPPLAKRAGRGVQFTIGDAVAVSVVRILVSTFGVKIQKLAPLSLRLFEVCADLMLPGRTPGFLVISGDQVEVISMSTSLLETNEAAMLVVPLQPIFNRFQTQLLRSTEDLQGLLPLGPALVSYIKKAS